MKRFIILLLPLLFACGDDPFRLTADSMLGVWGLQRVDMQDNKGAIEITSCTSIPSKVNLPLMQLEFVDLEQVNAYLPCYNAGPYPGYWVLREGRLSLDLVSIGAVVIGKVLQATPTTLAVEFELSIYRPVYYFKKE